MKHLPYLGLLGGLLVACSNVQVANTVASMEQTLTVAEKTADVYAKLPRCPQATGVACSDQTVVTSIAGLDQTAYAAVMAARTVENNGTTPDLNAAQTALAALTAALQNLP
jgi:hypothetical protein